MSYRAEEFEQLSFLHGGGDVGALMRAHNWANSPLGPPQDWPQSLRSVVGLMLNSKFPMFVAWGADLGFLYNDPYAQILGAKHPRALGARFFDIWSEIWPDISPLIDAAMSGQAIYRENLPLTMNRRGYDEDTWFTFSYSPVRDESGQVSGMYCACTETTANVLAERRLRESEERFRNMADNAPVMTWVSDPSGSCVYLNARWYEFTGQRPEDTGDFSWLDAVHRDDRAWSSEVFLAANAKREAVRLEYRLRRADGVYRWALDTASPRFDEAGTFLGFIGSVIDIDERREVESQLRESEARLRTITNAVPAFIWFATPDGHLHYFNDRWYEYTGQTEADALPDGWAKVLHPDDIERTAIAWAEARAREDFYEIEVRYRRRDGAYRWYVARAEPLRDASGAIITWFGTSTDIHERKLAEGHLQELNDTLERRVAERTAELAESQRRFRGIFDSALQFMALLTPAGTVVEVNQTALHWSQIEPRDIVGKPFWLAAPMRGNPELQAAVKAGIERAASGETVREEHEMRGAGEVRATVDFSLKPVRDEHGEAVWLVAEGRDITELKRAQNALRQAQKLEAIGQLTGGVAHDFNNLLTIIRSATDLLRRPGLAENRRSRYVEAISETVDRASKLTGQLLAFARRQVLKPEVFDPVQRIRSIREMLRTIAGSRVELAIQTDCERCFVEADASQFETALVNMVVNARDAMNGEGRLIVRVDETSQVPSVRGQAPGKGRFVAVSITDTGCGIPGDQLGQIFEPFYTTKGVGKGTGLGLSQVFGFAKQSGGDVAVESAVGRGTTFTLFLPHRDGVEAQVRGGHERRASPIAEDGRGRKILVVEDDIEVGQFSMQILQELGYETTWASTGDEALRILSEANVFDAVFSDVVMSGIDGVELGQEIRRRYPGLPVVLTSGYSQVLAEDGRHGFELIRKPYAVEEALSNVRQLSCAFLKLSHGAPSATRTA